MVRYQRVISKPVSLAAAKEEFHGMVVRAGYKPVTPITVFWQDNLFDDKSDVYAFVHVVKK